jgi:N-methylhydantoinase B/oxoprolinase/acetone carboxylase alpha subunit
MRACDSNAEMAVRKMLIEACKKAGTTVLSVSYSPGVRVPTFTQLNRFHLHCSSSVRSTIHPPSDIQATDYMDDGSPIVLTVNIDDQQGSATFDFTGTGPEVRGNWNAPISVVHSAIIYW